MTRRDTRVPTEKWTQKHKTFGYKRNLKNKAEVDTGIQTILSKKQDC